MNRLARIILVLAIAVPLGCSGNRKLLDHSENVSTSTPTGSSNAPSIVTEVSQGGQDTVTWNASGGAINSWSGLGSGTPYPTNTCGGGGAKCVSGPYTGLWAVGQEFNYTFKVGNHGPIYGRIIIRK